MDPGNSDRGHPEFSIGADASSPDTPKTYSLHFRVRAFAVFGDEAVDPRRHNGQRYRAELEHRIGMVTTALPSKCGKGDTFKS
jgi:hypothetical protein